MRKTIQIGISKTFNAITNQSQTLLLNENNTKRYNVLLSNEYEEDGKILTENWIHVECLDEGIPAISQSRIKGLGEKAENDAIDMITEAIQAIEEYKEIER